MNKKIIIILKQLKIFNVNIAFIINKKNKQLLDVKELKK